ncbi:MAG: type II secretion system F family protein [Pirellulaceae bacterium]
MSAYPAKALRPAAKNFLQQLASIQLGGASQKVKIKKRDMIFILRNIATLTENGLSLPKALETICKEKSLKKYSGMLGDIRQTVENGDNFSGGLLKYKDSFGELLISQIKIGEKSGTLPATLERLTQQLEHADNLKSTVIKKLSYPALLCVAGTGAVSFMILYVVPTFEKTYKESGAKLPAVTQFLIDVGHFAKYYGWMMVLGLVVSVVGWIIARRTPSSRLVIDRYLLRVPMVGDCLKNFAVLQFMEVLGNLMEAGFTMADALQSCAKAINNRAVRKSVEELHGAVLRGERFSSELEKHGDLFPPIVNQLIIVGEKTGTLGKATQNIRVHLKREVERYLSIMIGSIEPIMTVGLAAAIGTILLAIYLPMFDMIGSMK